MNGKTIIKGTIILTLSGIIVKIMGFFYRIYMSNLLGAEGMGLYQLIMPFYMLSFSITSAGLTTAVSKVTSAEMGKRRIKSGFNAGILASIIGAMMGVFIGAIGFFFSEFISCKILNAPLTALAIKILSLSFPFMAIASCMRGVFYGLGKTEVPAISQIIEQSTRIGVVFLLSGYFMGKGLEYACAIATLGMSGGEFFSFLYVFLTFKKEKRKVEIGKTLEMKNILKMLMIAAVPLTANRTLSSILSAVENMLIPRQLMAYGMEQSRALEVYGSLWGMVIPLIMFPSAFLLALSSAVMPVVSEKVAEGNKKTVKKITEITITIAVIIGMFATFLFYDFSDELGYAIYSDKNLGFYIKITALLCPLIYLQTSFAAILNGLSEQNFIFKNNIITSIALIGFIYFLVPIFEIKAFFAGWLLSLGISSFFSISVIQKKTQVQINIKGIIKSLSSGFLAFWTARIFCDKIIDLININFALLISISIASLLYIILIIYMGCIDLKEYKAYIFKK